MLTHHTVESGKIAGSKGLTDACRLVYRAKRDRENPGIRVLAIEKSNILAEADPVRYTIHGDGAHTFVRWLDRSELAQRRSAWRPPVTELPLHQVERKQVMDWAQHGGGDLLACAKCTGLPAEVCARHLADLQAAGAITARKQLRNPFRAR